MGWNPQEHQVDWQPADWQPLESGGAGDPPVFAGPIPGIFLTEDVVMIPFDTSDFFTGATSYSLAGTLPDGLVFDTETGIISGTPTTIENALGLVVTGTNDEGSDESNAFNIVVSAAVEPGEATVWDAPTKLIWGSMWRTPDGDN